MPQVEPLFARMKKKIAVAEALAAERERVAEKNLKSMEAIAINTSHVAAKYVALAAQLQECEAALDESNHELEKQTALATGFRARAEKAEERVARITNSEDYPEDKS